MKRFLKWILPKPKFTKGDIVLYLGSSTIVGKRVRFNLEYSEELEVLRNVRFGKKVKVRGHTRFGDEITFKLYIEELAIKEYALINWRKRIEG